VPHGAGRSTVRRSRHPAFRGKQTSERVEITRAPRSTPWKPPDREDRVHPCRRVQGGGAASRYHCLDHDFAVGGHSAGLAIRPFRPIGAGRLSRARGAPRHAVTNRRLRFGPEWASRPLRLGMLAVLLCEKFSYFRLRRVPGAVLVMPRMGGRAWGALHEMAGKKSLTTGQARFPWAF
jgi:hypothetical protein